MTPTRVTPPAPRRIELRILALTVLGLALLAGACGAGERAGTSPKPGESSLTVQPTVPTSPATSDGSSRPVGAVTTTVQVPGTTSADPPTPPSLGELDPAQQGVASRIAQGMISGSGIEVSEAEAECVGAGLVSRLGSARVLEIGTTLDGGALDLAADEVESVTGVVSDCVDLSSVVTSGLDLSDLDADARRCVEDSIGTELAREFMAAELLDTPATADPALLEAAVDEMSSCLSTEELGDVLGR